MALPEKHVHRIVMTMAFERTVSAHTAQEIARRCITTFNRADPVPFVITKIRTLNMREKEQNRDEEATESHYKKERRPPPR